MCTGDRVLRYINGEWTNVSTKCQRLKNLGYYDDIADDSDCPYDAGYAKDMETDDDDDYLPRYYNNHHRPDSFWMGDGFRKQRRPRYRPDYSSMRDQHVHYYGDTNPNDMYRDKNKRDRFLSNRYPRLSSLTWVENKVFDDKQDPEVRFTLPNSSLPMDRPIFSGYHHYARPMPPTEATAICAAPALPAVPASCFERCFEPKQCPVTKDCRCKNSPDLPNLNRPEPMPFLMQCPAQFMQNPLLGNESNQKSDQIEEKDKQKSNEPKMMVENGVQTDEPEASISPSTDVCNEIIMDDNHDWKTENIE